MTLQQQSCLPSKALRRHRLSTPCLHSHDSEAGKDIRNQEAGQAAPCSCFRLTARHCGPALEAGGDGCLGKGAGPPPAACLMGAVLVLTRFWHS